VTAGEIPVRPTNSDIAAHALYLQREGYRTSTIESHVSAMKTLARHSDIYNPDSVKSYLARLNVTEARKEAQVNPTKQVLSLEENGMDSTPLS